MEQKQTWHALEVGRVGGPAQTGLPAVSGFAPEAAPEAEPTAAPLPLPASVKADPILGLFDWLCAGPVSKWERELTRRARWRLA